MSALASTRRRSRLDPGSVVMARCLLLIFLFGRRRPGPRLALRLALAHFWECIVSLPPKARTVALQDKVPQAYPRCSKLTVIFGKRTLELTRSFRERPRVLWSARTAQESGHCFFDSHSHWLRPRQHQHRQLSHAPCRILLPPPKRYPTYRNSWTTGFLQAGCG